MNEALGVLIGDLNICETEEGRFNVWNQTFTDGDAVKNCPLSVLLPSCPRNCGKTNLQGKILQPMVPYALCPELTEHS